MEQNVIQPEKKSRLKKMILMTLIVMLVLVALWHLLLPALGITLAVSAGLWGVLIATIVLICVATMLFFIFTGIGILLTGIFVFLWTVVAIALFPILFPILIPVLLLMAVIGYLLKK